MLSLLIPLAITPAAALCGWVLYQLRLDRPTIAARHRPAPAPAVEDEVVEALTEVTADVPVVVMAYEVYDLLDPRMPLDEVGRYLESLGVADWRAPLTEWERAASVAAPRELEAAK